MTTTPEDHSPICVDIVSSTTTLHIDQDCSLAFRTCKDVAAPDGYIASKVIRRIYSVFSANKNIKKYADGASVTMVNGIVTHIIDADSFYIEERDKRLFGMRVNKIGHGLSDGDEVYVLQVTIATSPANSERYIAASSVTTTSPPSMVIIPFGIRGICLGGKDYLPAGGSGTNYGQVGVVNGQGVNNVGLLVRTVGVVAYIDNSTPPAWFMMSDGSGAAYYDGDTLRDGVKISADGLIPSGLEVGDFVTATGICSAK